MDIRYCNKDFNEAVLSSFQDVINEFKFNVKTETNSSGVELLNEKCIIKFVYDSGFLVTSLIDPKEKANKEKIKRLDGLPNGYPKYSLFSVWKFLYPNDNKNFRYADTDLLGQIKADKQLLEERLRNVLNGDFTWTAAYKQNDTRISKKVEYMTNHWSYDNPVRIKFREGDLSWEKDFDEYKRFLDEFQK